MRLRTRALLLGAFSLSGLLLANSHKTRSPPMAGRKLDVSEPTVLSAPNTDPAKHITVSNRSSVRETMGSAWTEALKAAFYGGAAGAMQVVTMMWLRTIVNYQYRYGVSFSSAVEQLYKQGGIRRFYSGFAFALFQGPLSKSGAMASNEGAKVLINNIGGLQNAHFLSSALGTVFATFWRWMLMPIDTFKTVLQVEGHKGFGMLTRKVASGNIGVLYQGSIAAAATTLVSHYPWFYTYNLLDSFLKTSDSWGNTVVRSALIGFTASAVSDACSNVVRVVKTVKQATSAELSGSVNSFTYWQVVQRIFAEGGFSALFTRGLLTRIAANGVQSMLFTIMWKLAARNAEDRRSNKKPEDL